MSRHLAGEGAYSAEGVQAQLQEWEDKLRYLQERALMERCTLPSYLSCPAFGCEAEFWGEPEWDNYMEHVARHLERAAQGNEPNIDFGTHNKPSLLQWASSPMVNILQRVQDGSWVLTRQSSIALQDPRSSHPTEEPRVMQQPPDSAYGSMGTTVRSEWKENQAHLSGTEARVEAQSPHQYSVAPSLDDIRASTYVSEFTNELRTALPASIEKVGWDRISPALGDILTEFAVRIAYEETLVDRSICRNIMYLVHRYHR